MKIVKYEYEDESYDFVYPYLPNEQIDNWEFLDLPLVLGWLGVMFGNIEYEKWWHCHYINIIPFSIKICQKFLYMLFC